MFVVPGEEVATVEEFMSGDGTYEDGERVYASVAGEVVQDMRERRVKVKGVNRIPRRNVVGSLVYGRVMAVYDQFVLLELFPYNTRRFRLIPPSPVGTIHVSKIKRAFVESAREEFEVGDWVRAKVLKIVKKFFVQLTTQDPDLGVIKAYCKHDRTPLVRVGRELKCPRCGRRYRRKIASDYGRPRLPR